jgi:hypothetical protein
MATKRNGYKTIMAIKRKNGIEGLAVEKPGLPAAYRGGSNRPLSTGYDTPVNLLLGRHL